MIVCSVVHLCYNSILNTKVGVTCVYYFSHETLCGVRYYMTIWVARGCPMKSSNSFPTSVFVCEMHDAHLFMFFCFFVGGGCMSWICILFPMMSVSLNCPYLIGPSITLLCTSCNDLLTENTNYNISYKKHCNDL